jgi:acetyl esterase/lipase
VLLLILRLALLAACAAALTGCGLVSSLVADVLYDEVALPDSLVALDLPYAPDPDGAPTDPKQRLDLFLPLPDSVRAGAWPLVLFVHGGGWTEGDRAFTFGGEDIYGNVGRFMAQRGIGAAVVSYRLQPEATWQEQVADVAAALAFVQRMLPSLGGDPNAVVLMGHSAGAQLAAHVAFDTSARRRAGAWPTCGLVPVSGVAYDLTDPATWASGAEFDYYSARFSPGREEIDAPPEDPAPWQREASPVTHIARGAPPTHLVYADGEEDYFRLQAEALARALAAACVPHEVSIMDAFNHEVGALYLSRADRTAGPAAVAMARACADRR